MNQNAYSYTSSVKLLKQNPYLDISLAELSFVSLSYTSAMAYLQALKIIFLRYIRFEIIGLYILNKFAPKATHIIAGISKY
jgi:hypothetical protein